MEFPRWKGSGNYSLSCNNIFLWNFPFPVHILLDIYFDTNKIIVGILLQQCCAILIGIGVISVLKSKIFDTFGIVSVLVLKEVCKRYWYWSRYCKKSLRGIGIGIGIETWRSHGIGIVLVSTYGYVKYWYRFEETYHNCWVLVSVLVSYMPCSGYWYRFRSRIFSRSIGIGIEKNPKYQC